MNDLPKRIIVDQNGHYWRDFGDSFSMCPTTDANDTTEAAAEYRLVETVEPPLPSDEVERGLRRCLLKMGRAGMDEESQVAVATALVLIRSLEREVARLTEECAWLKAIPIEGYDPDVWRTDAGNTWIKRKDYGDRGSKFGWVVGSDGRPVQWDKEERSAD